MLWNIKVFTSEKAKAGYEHSSLADELREEILGGPAGRAADARGRAPLRRRALKDV